MHGLKVKHAHAQAIIVAVKQHAVLAHNFMIAHDSDYVYIPTVRVVKLPHTIPIQRTFTPRHEKKDLRALLRQKLTPNELVHFTRAMDIIGDIAILEIDPLLKRKEKSIAQALLQTNKSIHTVLKKASSHTGTYRLQKYTYLAGTRTKETVHKENGVRMHLHLEKTYFSPRLATERLRIARLVKKKEKILVMFSGIAAYPLVLARNSPAATITGIELNSDADRYAHENISLNGFTNITLYCGDVKKIVPRLKQKYDRIIMPLPKDASAFLNDAKKCSSKETVIHYYHFLKEDEVKTAKATIKKTFPHAKFLRAVKCGQPKPYVWRYCIDFQVR